MVDRPAPVLAVKDGDRVEGEDASEAVQQGRYGRGAGETRERFGLGARPCAVRRSPRSEGDEGAHDRSHREEDRQREQIFALRDRERVKREA